MLLPLMNVFCASLIFDPDVIMDDRPAIYIEMVP